MRATVKWYLAVLVILCLVGVVQPGHGQAIDSAWLAKTSEGATTVYAKYKTLSSHLEEECEYRTDKAAGPAGTIPFSPHTRRERVVHFADNMIVEQIRILDNMPKQPQIRLQCDNSDYHFTLSRSQEDAPYIVAEYDPGKRKIPLIQQQPGLHSMAYSHLRDILAAIEGRGECTLQRLRFDDAKGLLLVEYTVTAGGTSAQNQIYIDPSHNWRVVERRVETSNLVATTQWNYGVTIDGLEFPTGFKNLMMYKVAKAPPNLEITGRLINLKTTDKRPEDFRLSAFDFPEPIDVAPLPKMTRWYLWITVAAIASAALATFFAWLKRRHSKMNAFSPKAS